MEPLVDVGVREDGPAGDADRIDFRPEGVVDLTRVPPELVVVYKPERANSR